MALETLKNLPPPAAKFLRLCSATSGRSLTNFKSYSHSNTYSKNQRKTPHNPIFLPFLFLLSNPFQKVPLDLPILSSPPFSCPALGVLSMSSPAGLRLFRISPRSSAARFPIRKPAQRRFQSTEVPPSSAGSTQNPFQRLWNSPVGLKTVHFWFVLYCFVGGDFFSEGVMQRECSMI